VVPPTIPSATSVPARIDRWVMVSEPENWPPCASVPEASGSVKPAPAVDCAATGRANVGETTFRAA